MHTNGADFPTKDQRKVESDSKRRAATGNSMTKGDDDNERERRRPDNYRLFLTFSTDPGEDRRR